MQVGARLFGVLVDSVFRTEEIVVKPLSSLLRDIGIFSGNTILGDGSVIMIIDPNALGLMVGSVEAQESDAAETQASSASSQEQQKTALLLFRAGSPTLKAVPLSLITRLEEIELAAVERCNGDEVVQYRGALMPLVHIAEAASVRTDGVQPVLVFTEAARPVGLVIDEIVDIVEEPLVFELQAESPGIIGAAIIKGKTVEIVDLSHYLGKALGKRLGGALPAGSKPRLLLIDDSQFFRNMLAPLLTANGYDVTLAASAAEALALKDKGAWFDVIVSDLDMPEMDGFAFAEKVRHDPEWGATPLVALSSHTNPRFVEKSRASGFESYVGKFDRQKLLGTLQQCCKGFEAAA
jgi:two-component system chemotaxis sensor kinase CheA